MNFQNKANMLIFEFELENEIGCEYEDSPELKDEG